MRTAAVAVSGPSKPDRSPEKSSRKISRGAGEAAGTSCGEDGAGAARGAGTPTQSIPIELHTGTTRGAGDPLSPIPAPNSAQPAASSSAAGTPIRLAIARPSRTGSPATASATASRIDRQPADRP